MPRAEYKTARKKTPPASIIGAQRPLHEQSSRSLPLQASLTLVLPLLSAPSSSEAAGASPLKPRLRSGPEMKMQRLKYAQQQFWERPLQSKTPPSRTVRTLTRTSCKSVFSLPPSCALVSTRDSRQSPKEQTMRCFISSGRSFDLMRPTSSPWRHRAYPSRDFVIAHGIFNLLNHSNHPWSISIDSTFLLTSREVLIPALGHLVFSHLLRCVSPVHRYSSCYSDVGSLSLSNRRAGTGVGCRKGENW